jgi:ATP-dependent DNA helicase DinG
VISLDEIFAIDGPLAKVRGTLEPRPGQLQMARLIERGILEQVHTIVEAGTGVGKSYGYIIPALRSGKRVVISTCKSGSLKKTFPKLRKPWVWNPKLPCSRAEIIIYVAINSCAKATVLYSRRRRA